MMCNDESAGAAEGASAEQISIERALADAERRYQALFNDSPSPIFVFDPATREFLAVNRTALECYGYTLDEFMALKITDIRPPEEVPRLLESLSEPPRETAWKGTWRHQRKDGTLFDAEIVCHSIKLDGREARISVITDVTERRRAEALLRESEERFRGTFEQAAVGMAHLSPEGRWLRVNRKLCETVGYREEQMLRMTADDITAPEDLPASLELRARLVNGAAETATWEKRYIRGDGSLTWAKVTTKLVRTPAGEPAYFIAVIEDISRDKEMEAQMLRTQRLESVGTLASGVAHDLNNILAPIIMSVPMLRLEMEAGMKESLISTIESSARRGADIVRQILTFTRGIEGDRLLLQPIHILKELGNFARETFPKNILVREQYEPTVWPVYGDPTQLHQVLMNLAVNARDAMPAGGTLALAAHNLEVDGQYAATLGTGIQPGNYMVWTVSDTGTGIPVEIQDRIFDPFFTTKEVGKGTGLGLSTVIGIARSHGGAVTVESAVGKGTKMSVYLPATPGELFEEKEPELPEAMQGKGELVLMVDDEGGVLDMSRLVLERNGYRIAIAKDGIEGVAYFARHQDEIALVITDIHMPNFDGLSLVQAIRKLNPRIPIIGSTGQTSSDEEEKLNALGVNRFLKKPYTKSQLLGAIRELLLGAC